MYGIEKKLNQWAFARHLLPHLTFFGNFWPFSITACSIERTWTTGWTISKAESWVNQVCFQTSVKVQVFKEDHKIWNNLPFTGLSSVGVPGLPWHPQILADQLTLSQPGEGTDYAHVITTGTPGFSDLLTALSLDELGFVWLEMSLSSYDSMVHYVFPINSVGVKRYHS